MKTDENIFDSFKKISTFIIARGLPAIINFGATTFYAHKLYPAEYGEYSLSLLWATFLSVLMFSWLNMALLRFYEENKNDHELFLYTIRQAFFLLSAGFVLISLPFYFLVHKIIFFIVILTIGQSFFQLFLQLLVSEVKPKSYARLATLNAALSFLLAYVLISYGKMGSLGIITALALSNFISVSQLYASNWCFNKKYKMDTAILGKCFLYGYPLSLSLILGIIFYGLDRVMLNFFCGKDSVGLYSLPYDLTNQSVTLIFMAFQLYLYPLVVKILHTDGEVFARKKLAENGKLFLILVIPCMLVLMCFASQIGHLVTRMQYRHAFAQVMPIIAIGAVLQGFKAYYYDLAFQLSRKTLIQLYVSGVVIIVNFVLNLLLIPKFNYLGAAYASLFTSLIAILSSYFIGKKYFHIPSLLVKNNLVFFIFAGLIGVALFEVKNISNPFIMVISGIFALLVYFFLVFISLRRIERAIS